MHFDRHDLYLELRIQFARVVLHPDTYFSLILAIFSAVEVSGGEIRNELTEDQVRRWQLPRKGKPHVGGLIQ